MAFGRSAAACFCAPAPGSLDRRIGGVAYHRSPVFFYIEQEMRKKISRNRSPGRSRALSRRDEGGRVEQPMLAAGEQYNDRNKQAQNGRMPMTKTRKTIAAQLAALCLVAVSLPALAQSDQQKQLYEAAKKEGTLTWYSGVMDQALCEKVGKAFTAKYPGVQVDATKTTSQVAFHRLLQDIRAGRVRADVFTSTDAGLLVFLKEKGALVKSAGARCQAALRGQGNQPACRRDHRADAGNQGKVEGDLRHVRVVGEVSMMGEVVSAQRRASRHREEPPRGGVSNGETAAARPPQDEDELY